MAALHRGRGAPVAEQNVNIGLTALAIAEPQQARCVYRASRRLFHRHTFGQVARLVDVRAA